MNVYDFDKTIYKKDSSVQLYLYVIKKKPYVLFKCIPNQIKAMIYYKIGRIKKEKCKEAYFSFLQFVDIKELLDKFVELEVRNVADWYRRQKRADDVIVSASPDFLIRAFGEKLHIENIIASDVDEKSGRFLGNNCYGEEKVRRFSQMFNLDMIDDFYSDSKSDKPMAEKAKRAFIVKGEKLVEWEID